MGFTIQRFRLGRDEKLWNNFIKTARNSSFIFNRGFMDYHSNRFNDHSIMILNDKQKMIACFPANEFFDNEIHSHGGLTYGSFILEPETKLLAVIEVYKAVLEYYEKLGFERIIYKAFPRFYNLQQTDEVEYCLFLSKAKLLRRDTSIAVDRENRIKYAGNIRREAKKAQEAGVLIMEDQDLEGFWENVLEPNLKKRFGVDPLHSIQEITHLKSLFHSNIKLFTAREKDSKIVAGTVFFSMENVAHCQYISANEHGRNSGALNLLFVTLLDEFYQDKRYFDFGTTNGKQGKEINIGLLSWKERMGGRTYSHDFYSINTSNHELLN